MRTLTITHDRLSGRGEKVTGRTVVVTDSSAALPVSDCQRYGIHVVPIQFTLGQQTFTDGHFSEEEFAAYLEPGINTNAPGPTQFLMRYQEAEEGGATEIIVPLISSKLSTTFENAKQAAAPFMEHHPGVRVHLFDSGFVSLGLGWQVLTAARLAEEGESSEAILAALEDQKSRTVLYALLNDLYYAYRGGRISKTQYRVAEFAHIKGLVGLYDGEVAEAGKAPLMKWALNKMESLINGHAPYELATVSSQTGDQNAQRLAQQLKNVRLDPAHIPLPTTILIHSGPGTVGFVGVSAK